MSYCPAKMISCPIPMKGLAFENAPNNENLTKLKLLNWECEGIECEFFNVDYGRCGKYVETLTIDERVDLKHSNNSGRKK